MILINLWLPLPCSSHYPFMWKHLIYSCCLDAYDPTIALKTSPSQHIHILLHSRLLHYLCISLLLPTVTSFHPHPRNKTAHLSHTQKCMQTSDFVLLLNPLFYLKHFTNEVTWCYMNEMSSKWVSGEKERQQTSSVKSHSISYRVCASSRRQVTVS